MKAKMISLNQIKLDQKIQPRVNLSESTIKEYAEDILMGAKFPPVDLFFDGEINWLADGYHRYHAMKKAEKDSIKANIHEGKHRDAILFSVKANANHGLRRTNEDKNRAVEKLLIDPEWRQWSDVVISEHCCVSQPFVSKFRKNLSYNGFKSTSTRKGKDGRTIDTSNIGIGSINLPVSDLSPTSETNEKKENRPVNKEKAEDVTTSDQESNNISDDSPTEDRIFNQSLISDFVEKLNKLGDEIQKDRNFSDSKLSKVRKMLDEVRQSWVEISFHLDEMIPD